MSPNFHTVELAVVAELAMKQSLRCERAAESIDDPSLAASLSSLSRGRTLLRLELEARLRAMGGVPLSPRAGSGGLNGLHAAQRMDLVPDAQSLLRQVAAAEDELFAALIGFRALGELHPATRLGAIIDGMTKDRRALGPSFEALGDAVDHTSRDLDSFKPGWLSCIPMGVSSLRGRA
jgi:hypothetical protein